MDTEPRNQREVEEEQAAAAEAASIGGHPGHVDDVPPEERAPREAGQGEQEGFEIAEADLIEHAAHGDPAAPLPDDLGFDEVESERSTASYGEGDEEDSTAVTRDPEAGPDDPGEGPGLTTER